jgi:hypothetical protein
MYDGYEFDFLSLSRFPLQESTRFFELTSRLFEFSAVSPRCHAPSRRQRFVHHVARVLKWKAVVVMLA